MQRKRKRDLKHDRKVVLEKALYLLNECDQPLKVVMKRLKLKRGLLERLKKRGRADPDLFVK